MTSAESKAVVAVADLLAPLFLMLDA